MKKIMIFCMALCMGLLSACGVHNNNDAVTDLGKGVVLAVGGSKMTSAEFQFFLDDIKNQMEGTELSAEDGWESEIEGKKAIDIAKDRAYESAVLYLTRIELAKKLGLSYEKDDMKSLKEQINTSYFEKYDNADDLIELFCEASLYTTELQKKLVAEEPVKDSEIDAYFNEHEAELNEKYMRAKHILLLTQDPETGEEYSEDVKMEKMVKAGSLVLRATKDGEDFDALAAEYSEDPGLKSNPNGYVFTSGEMVAEFEDCVKSLGIDEIGPVVESSYGYHVIKRLALDAESCKEIITNTLYSEKFEEYVDRLAKENGITAVRNDEEYNKIK